MSSSNGPLPDIDLDTLLGARTLASLPKKKWHRRKRGGGTEAEIPDPLYRVPGQALYPERYNEEALALRRSRPREWAALYQQDPRVDGGSLIIREMFTTRDPRKTRHILSAEVFAERTKGLLWNRGYDLAYTAKEWNKEDPDWSVGIKKAFAVDEDDLTFDIYIDDMRRFQRSWSETKQTLRSIIRDEDGHDVWQGIESNGPQKMALSDLQDMPSLAEYRDVIIGLPLSYYNTTTDKSARAQWWAAKAQEGRVWLKEAPWNGPWLDELEAFPNGSHDDIVDAMSVAFALCAMRMSAVAPTIQRQSVPFFQR